MKWRKKDEPGEASVKQLLGQKIAFLNSGWILDILLVLF